MLFKSLIRTLLKTFNKKVHFGAYTFVLRRHNKDLSIYKVDVWKGSIYMHTLYTSFISLNHIKGVFLQRTWRSTGEILRIYKTTGEYYECPIDEFKSLPIKCDVAITSYKKHYNSHLLNGHREIYLTHTYSFQGALIDCSYAKRNSDDDIISMRILRCDVGNRFHTVFT